MRHCARTKPAMRRHVTKGDGHVASRFALNLYLMIRYSATRLRSVRGRAAPAPAPCALRRSRAFAPARFRACFCARRRAAAAMGGCVSVEEKPCPPGTFSSKELLELNLLRAAALGNVSEAKTALAAGATTAAKTAVRATRGDAQRGSPWRYLATTAAISVAPPAAACTPRRATSRRLLAAGCRHTAGMAHCQRPRALRAL